MKWWSFSERTAKPHHHPSSSLCLWDLWKHTGWVVFVTPALLLHLQSDERSRRRSCCSFCSHSVIFPSQLDQQVYTNWASVQLSLEDFAASQLFFFQSSCVSVLLTDVFCLFNCSEPLRTSKHHLRLQMFGCWRGFFFSNLWLVISESLRLEEQQFVYCVWQSCNLHSKQRRTTSRGRDRSSWWWRSFWNKRPCCRKTRKWDVFFLYNF